MKCGDEHSERLLQRKRRSSNKEATVIINIRHNLPFSAYHHMHLSRGDANLADCTLLCTLVKARVGKTMVLKYLFCLFNFYVFMFLCFMALGFNVEN